MLAHCLWRVHPRACEDSKSFSLIDCISVVVDRMQRNFEPMASPGAKACRLEEWPGCVKTVSKLLLFGALELYLSEKQMPQVVGFIRSRQNQESFQKG